MHTQSTTVTLRTIAATIGVIAIVAAGVLSLARVLAWIGGGVLTLGEPIGYTKTGLGQTSAELRRWILGL